MDSRGRTVRLSRWPGRSGRSCRCSPALKEELIYEYKARWIQVLDADTVRCELDLGLDTYHKLTIRLAGINAPELSTEEGKAARDAFQTKIAHEPVMIRTIKDSREKFGRYLGVVLVDGVNLNEWLLEQGLAVPYP